MVGREGTEIRSKAIDLLSHMRLHFQLLLAPIFLWGYFLSGVRAPVDFRQGFAAFHIFLYGGITAFNSYYDRDQGPVGGMRVPPPVTEALLPFSLAVLVAGAVVAIAIAQRLDLIRAALVVGFYAILLVATAARANEFQQLDVMRQQRRVMVLNAIMSGGFFNCVKGQIEG